MPKDSGIGASTKRREDIRFLTGLGQYTIKSSDRLKFTFNGN